MGCNKCQNILRLCAKTFREKEKYSWHSGERELFPNRMYIQYPTSNFLSSACYFCQPLQRNKSCLPHKFPVSSHAQPEEKQNKITISLVDCGKWQDPNCAIKVSFLNSRKFPDYVAYSLNSLCTCFHKIDFIYISWLYRSTRILLEKQKMDCHVLPWSWCQANFFQYKGQ